MLNKIRGLLLASAIGLIVFSGIKIYSGYESSIGNIQFTDLEEGIDVQIENFKLSHESNGKKEWELKAHKAQINQKEDTTHLQKVDIKMARDNGRPFSISADQGTLNNKTEEFHLEGNVRLIGEPSLIKERMAKTNQSDPNPEAQTQ
ncbi:MAG: LPS export ABC transporter periplasmic protein LptC [Candidatus Nitrohelix vancouverensis]|uniref:LPS export ABC transporter periplasmic protein LptC n=1 Tax=Candidatus Nitrohelix vancouverensis TaxID=2705534 RepID=A0A7T0C376_9BACT|nr:MAG: LPS export ABC transporter periplasmic protein LptC [Candidatus Nitrohelix vancouverensis]